MDRATDANDFMSRALQHEGLSATRVSGLNRYSTSAAVAREIARLRGPLFAKAAFVARLDFFADALALAPFAYSQGYPVLLTRSDGLVTECSGAISGLGISDLYIAGSDKAVSAGVMSALNALPSVTAPASGFLSDHASEVIETEVYGGSNVVSDAVKSRISHLAVASRVAKSGVTSGRMSR